jgi:hypothetical protein
LRDSFTEQLLLVKLQASKQMEALVYHDGFITTPSALISRRNGKVCPITSHEDTVGEYRYSSVVFFNLGARFG